MPELLSRFAMLLRSVTESDIRADATLSGRLYLEQSENIVVSYAPFEHIQRSARVALVGITPGAQQAANSLIEARRQLVSGSDHSLVLSAAKVFASFSGAMRSNLVAMLDHVGVHSWLGLSSTAALWGERSDLVHFTSAIRYPVFVGGKNYNGRPPISAVPLLTKLLMYYLREEADALPNVLWIPLGPAAAQGIGMLVREGIIKPSNVLEGLPHPSGANAERVAYFVGRKSREALSNKTNAETLDNIRGLLFAQVARLPRFT